MTSRTDFDDEHFFGSYQAERAAVDDAQDDEAEHQLPTPEQLAHRNRFRKPVAWAVVGLTLFSLLALEEHGAQREYVAHLSAALPAPEPVIPTASLPEDAADATTLLGEISIQADSPDAPLDCTPGEFVSELTSMCWPQYGFDGAPNRDGCADGSATTNALDTAVARGPRPRSVGSSSPFDDLIDAIGAALNE